MFTAQCALNIVAGIISSKHTKCCFIIYDTASGALLGNCRGEFTISSPRRCNKIVCVRARERASEGIIVFKLLERPDK